MDYLFLFLTLISLVRAQYPSFEAAARPVEAPQRVPRDTKLSGRWRVKFDMSGMGEKNLLFDAQGRGVGSFLLLDTAPDGQSADEPQPGAWSQTTNNRVNFSGEVELPIGTCCREVGTLVFKGNFNSPKSISGKAIFVASTTDAENCIGFRGMLGTFTATRISTEN